jgi:hypothetical protein
MFYLYKNQLIILLFNLYDYIQIKELTSLLPINSINYKTNSSSLQSKKTLNKRKLEVSPQYSSSQPLHSSSQPLHNVTSSPQLSSPQPSSPQPSSPQPLHHNNHHETMPGMLQLNHSKSIWKQEYITSATNLLANLNELEHITKSIKRLCVNIPEGIEETTKNLNAEMGAILEKINENEDIKKLKDISNKVWKERNIQDKRNKFVSKENIYPLSPSKKQRRHDSHAIF